MAFVVDEQETRLYVNGVCGLPTARQTEKLHASLPIDGLWLGARTDEVARGSLAYLYRGQMDEVRLSRCVRYRDTFKPQSRFESDEETIALYHCDEGRGNKLVDSSSNGHDGHVESVTRAIVSSSVFSIE